MPTNSTDTIKHGISFEHFALRCARDIDYLEILRDLPDDAPIPERIEPSPYYRNMFEESRLTLERISAWTMEQAEAEYGADFGRRADAHSQAVRAAADLQEKYTTMLHAVRSWTAPTPNHIRFKAYMEEQLMASIRSDCVTPPAPPPQSPAQWRDAWITDLKESIARYEQKYADAVQRAHESTQWLQALRGSLR